MNEGMPITPEEKAFTEAQLKKAEQATKDRQELERKFIQESGGTISPAELRAKVDQAMMNQADLNNALDKM